MVDLEVVAQSSMSSSGGMLLSHESIIPLFEEMANEIKIKRIENLTHRNPGKSNATEESI